VGVHSDGVPAHRPGIALIALGVKLVGFILLVVAGISVAGTVGGMAGAAGRRPVTNPRSAPARAAEALRATSQRAALNSGQISFSPSRLEASVYGVACVELTAARRRARR